MIDCSFIASKDMISGRSLKGGIQARYKGGKCFEIGLVIYLAFSRCTGLEVSTPIAVVSSTEEKEEIDGMSSQS